MNLDIGPGWMRGGRGGGNAFAWALVVFAQNDRGLKSWRLIADKCARGVVTAMWN